MLNSNLINPIDFIKIGIMAMIFAMLIKWLGRKAGITAAPAAAA